MHESALQVNDLMDMVTRQAAMTALRHEVGKGGERHLLLSGLYASARQLVLAQLAWEHSLLVVLDQADDAQSAYGDMKTLLGNGQVCFFPVSHRRRQRRDEAMAIQRTEALSALSDGRRCVVITYPEALTEEVPNREQFQQATLRLETGQEVAVSKLSELLVNLGFRRVDFVYEPGQFAIRGGIVDVYSYSHDDPYRLDFFGDEIDSIKEFDIETQLSKEKVAAIDVIGRKEGEEARPGRLYDYLQPTTLWVSNDWEMVRYRLEGGGDTVGMATAAKGVTLEMADKSYFAEHVRIAWETMPQPAFHKQFDLLIADLEQKMEAGYRLYLLAEQQKQIDRLRAIFEDKASSIQFTAVGQTLHAGFVDQAQKICCYTDHEIFERFHRVALGSENARRGKAIMTLKEINQLQLGDYVVHSDHGIARFGGLVVTPVNGKPQEMIKLTYRDGDCVFVSIHNLHRISKYKGHDGVEPTISRLGSGAWERLKERTKDKVKAVARDLIKLYAKRKQQPGFAYSPDGYMQHELEASFFYEDTPDQAKATVDVKRDMESRRPMDRLVCGDVGFGKTEVAMRAAFKAATDGKQVAVLVPTTVLALQHYTTFRERMKDFPVTVEMLSRMRSATDTKAILERLKKGEIDILIGTHKLVGKTVEWKDLGLLIVDEEQKFGVAVKDKLKSLRANIDVLTLTATPIPRTLQFSLLGARDLSVMTTPPQNRYPVQTELITPADEDIMTEAIRMEMQRNGQIFVVNNRIEMLERLEHKLHDMVPEARIVIAHGQMPPDEMEKRLEDFINYDYDILLSTTIIESGIDIPNVNTIIIYSAQHYGLSDLHQLRGRVGRSNKKAYCYLVAPDRELLTADARRRLEALSTFAELGAGFNLAMQDLDIRGAGNLLGAEQSGFIADLGYETYQRILNEAVQELKEELEEEGEGELIAQEADRPRNQWVEDTQLESDLPLGFPSDYVSNISERISLYRELDSLRTEEQLLEYRKRLIDRFGTLPESAEELLNVVRLRWLCCRMGIEKVLLKGERLVLYFVTNKPAYYQSEIFGRILQYVCSRAQRCTLTEEKERKTGKPTGKRYASIREVRTIGGAMNLLSKIADGDWTA